jgi:hypothetical protein
MAKESSAAKIVDTSLAHLQHAMDKVTAWAFDQMQKAGESAKEPTKEEKKSAMGKAKTAGRTLIKFLGQTGKNYYKTYDELKQKKEKESAKH